MAVNKKLQDVKEEVSKGKYPVVTVREFLAWFGASRRGRWVVHDIRSDLKQAGLVTAPDFEGEYIDGVIQFFPAAKVGDRPEQKGAKPVAAENETGRAVEPAHRISRLEAAHREPLCVNGGDTLDRAVTLMMQYDYSQLPVMPNKGTVKGMVSWRSIGRRLHAGNKCSKVEDCIERAHEVRDTASMFEAVRLLAFHDALLVRATNGSICGIITNADIGAQFGTLAEPFLLLGDIEAALRHLIERSFSLEEIKAAVDKADDSRKAESVNDLTFGECLRIIEKQPNWDRLKLRLDRPEVVKQLEAVKRTRNDVMHFDPDPLPPEALDLLRSVAKFLSGILDLLE